MRLEILTPQFGAVARQGLAFFRPLKRDASGAAFMLKDPDGRPLFFINLHK